MSVDKFGVDAEAEARIERLIAKAHEESRALVLEAMKLSQKTAGADRETMALVIR